MNAYDFHAEGIYEWMYINSCVTAVPNFTISTCTQSPTSNIIILNIEVKTLLIYRIELLPHNLANMHILKYRYKQTMRIIIKNTITSTVCHVAYQLPSMEPPDIGHILSECGKSNYLSS